MTRLGALRLQGTEGVAVSGCTFERLDGQAVLLDGYNRDASFTRNTFYLIGGSGVVLWGYETNGDGTDGNQPRRTTVSENFCHEIGIYQKQSSCYFHAVSAQSTVTKNLFFNGPRAMVNFNDAFGGGHDLGFNLIFNSWYARHHYHLTHARSLSRHALASPAGAVFAASASSMTGSYPRRRRPHSRESSDHGAFNSWDRQPYLSDVGGEDGMTTTAEPAYSRLHNNFIVANYAADGGCYDNDVSATAV
jgi:hypothetical protein